jgi:hypothetical protein
MTQTVGERTAEGRRGSHDWHSAEYVKGWVEENEARIESRRTQFDLIGDFIPHRADAAISILDVGAGWGPVTRHLLKRFPNARATLFDYSDQMFGEARRVLAEAGLTDRVWTVKGDLSAPRALDGALREAGRPYVLVGFGRWGSSDAWLGVPLPWARLSGAAVLVEATLPGFEVQPSQGAHFFHNLVAARAAYLCVPHQGPGRIDWDWLTAHAAGKGLVRHVILNAPLEARISARRGRGVILRP